MNKNIWIILFVTILVILTLVNIYKPYITTHPANNASKIIVNSERANVVNQVKKELADITEQSLIKHASKTHGFDTNVQGYLNSDIRPHDTRLVVSEGFDTTIPLISEAHELRFFYRPDCSYSMAFMPVWLELSKSVPSNVTVKEINCGVLDSNGVSVCANWLEYGGGITSVPAIQLVSNIAGVKRTGNYSGSRSYQNISRWLNENGITLAYNPNAEHFTDSNPLTYNYGAKEGFSDDSIYDTTTFGDPGKMADNYDKSFLDLAQEDKYGHIRDVDKNGFYTATFSRCQPDSQGPEGYQVFTRRGQWGCVVPDAKTGINTPFDAAFAAVDSYLSTLPPLTDPTTGKLTGKTHTDEERMETKRNIAAKYSKDIRAFGLCDEARLKDKYNTYERIKAGRAKLPDGISLKDYLDTQETASAIYSSCSL